MPHKLLLADDSVTIQRVIELTFADEDVRVIAVGDGKQAIEKIQTERPDIVLADVGMPERDGYEVAAFVKGHPEFAHVPVLLLTGAFEPIDEGRAREVGCDGVLVKPFEPQMVINRVKDLLAGRRPAGLWAAAPAAQPSKPPVPSDIGPRGAAGAASALPAQNSAGTLEDYFDRLDAAFADQDTSAPAAGGHSTPAAPPVNFPVPPADSRTRSASVANNDPLGGWDPDLSDDPERHALKAEPQAVTIEPTHTIAPPPIYSPPPEFPRDQVTPPASVAPPDPVAQPAPDPAPDPVRAKTLPRVPSLPESFAALLAAEQGRSIAPASVRPEDIPDATIEDIVRRVIDRMGMQSVHETVLDVAERLVREEIERIKRG
jgi:CheY-like chemotaxis protein